MPRAGAFPDLGTCVEIELWRVDYNTERSHNALDYRSPTAFGDRVCRKGPPPAGVVAALFGGEEQRPARGSRS